MNVDECTYCHDTGVVRWSGLELWCERCLAGQRGAGREEGTSTSKRCEPVPCPPYEEATLRVLPADVVPDFSIRRGGIRWPVPATPDAPEPVVEPLPERVWRFDEPHVVFPEGCVCHLVDDVDRGETFVAPREGCPVHTPWAFPGYSLGTLDEADRRGLPEPRGWTPNGYWS